MHREVILDKIGYMMGQLGDSDELSLDDLENLIHKTFMSSLEFDHGFEADLIRALVDARYALKNYDNTDDEDASILAGVAAEDCYVACQKNMYVAAGCPENYADESASWPESLPLEADWDAELLEMLARKEVARHLVTMDQIRTEMEKHKTNDKNEHADS